MLFRFRLFASFGFLMFLLGTHSAQAGSCSDDMVSEIATTDACFAIDTLSQGNVSSLIVFIHGDSGMSKNGRGC